jgi:uncharacterized small protein (DUF1192 family)
MHDTLTIGIPVLTILFGILLNQRGLDKLELRLSDRMNGLEGRIADLTARIDRIQADLARFYQILASMAARSSCCPRSSSIKPNNFTSACSS